MLSFMFLYLYGEFADEIIQQWANLLQVHQYVKHFLTVRQDL